MATVERDIGPESRQLVSPERKLSRNLLPAICDVSVTNICNAACDFCGFLLEQLHVRIRAGIDKAHALSIPVWACVTVTRLVDYDALPDELEKLGFDAVTFSYPRRERFGSSSLFYIEESELMDQTSEELLAALDSIKRLKTKFRVLDPAAALGAVARFVKGEKQLVSCIAGHKYFYIDWNLDVWRCEPWAEPMGSVFDLDTIPDQREPCNACMMSCYRQASVLMHWAIALTDSAQALVRGDIRRAISSLFQRGVAYSMWALAVEEWPRAAFPSRKRRSNVSA